MAGFIPNEIIDEIRRRIDIVEFIGRYVQLQKRGRNFIGLCPFHNEKTPSFIVSPDKEIFHCFGCQKGGNVINFYMAIENLTFPEAVENLAKELGMVLPKREQSPAERAKYEARQIQYAIHEEAMKMFCAALQKNVGQQARDYLTKREINAEIREKFKLGYAPDTFDYLTEGLKARGFTEEQLLQSGLVTKSEKNGKLYDVFRNRVMFPIFDYKGKVIAFGGRIMDKGEPKYLNSPQTLIFDKSKTLYALNFAGNNIRNKDKVVIMEGYIDVITAHRYGVDNAVASLGTAFTNDHGSLLHRYTNNVLLAYDGDAAGLKAAKRGMEILREQGFELSVLLFPPGNDPDDFLRHNGKAAWDNLVDDKARPYLEFKLEQAILSVDLATVSGKSEVVRALLPDIVKCRDQVEREVFISLIARKVGVSEDAIYADLRKTGVNTTARSHSPAQKQIPKKVVPTIEKDDRLAASLTFYAISSQEVYEKVKKTLGFDFTSRQSLQELLQLVQNLESSYDWNPASLFSHITNEEVVSLLLTMLEQNIAPDELSGLADGCIKAVQIERLQRKVNEATQQLATEKEKDAKEALLKQIVQLQQDIRELRK